MRGLDPRIHLKKTLRGDGLPGQARQQRIMLMPIANAMRLNGLNNFTPHTLG
jgi:hypothetical protein